MVYSRVYNDVCIVYSYMIFFLHNRPFSFNPGGPEYRILCSVGMSGVLSWKCSYSERKTRQCFGSQSVVTLRIQSHKACSRSAQYTPWSDLICSQSHCSALTMDDIHTFSHRQVSSNLSAYLQSTQRYSAFISYRYCISTKCALHA